jgi:glycosyltransferase involved in cell wall biosynthesis
MNKSYNKERISVIMPVFKPTIRFLEKSILSILNQTYDNFELIIVYDDCGSSVDKIAFSLMKRYHQEDNRVKIIKNKPPIGFVLSLNQGLLHATGNYIARMDYDDISLRNRLEEQLNYIHDKGVDLIGSWAYVINESDKIVDTLTPPVDPRKISTFFLLHNPLVHSSIVFRREVIERIGMYQPSFVGAEDYEFYFRFLKLGYKIANVPRYLVCIRETRHSITRSPYWFRSRINYIKVKNKILRFCGLANGWTLFYLVLSFSSFLILPSLVPFIRKLLPYLGYK